MLGKSKLGRFWLSINYKSSVLRIRMMLGRIKDGP
jgi:hypothetical protein